MFNEQYLMIDEMSFHAIAQRAELITKIDINIDQALITRMADHPEEVSLIGTPVLQKQGTRAMISVDGPMMFSPGLFDRLMFGAVSTQEVMAAVTDVRQDDGIESVVFNFNSPGGEAHKIHVLADMVHELSMNKSTASVNTGIMASAAFFVGSQASKVFSEDSLNETGSIGTVTVLRDFSEAAKMAGIKVNKIATGPQKGGGIMGTAITADMIESVQKKVDKMQENFSNAVTRMRPDADMADGSEARSGQSFFQEDADRLGLSDGIKSIEQAFRFLEDGNSFHKLRQTI